jgi:hypothetical protein
MPVKLLLLLIDLLLQFLLLAPPLLRTQQVCVYVCSTEGSCWQGAGVLHTCTHGAQGRLYIAALYVLWPVSITEHHVCMCGHTWLLHLVNRCQSVAQAHCFEFLSLHKCRLHLAGGGRQPEAPVLRTVCVWRRLLLLTSN